jgi:hypothetical protein
MEVGFMEYVAQYLRLDYEIKQKYSRSNRLS